MRAGGFAFLAVLVLAGPVSAQDAAADGWSLEDTRQHYDLDLKPSPVPVPIIMSGR